jgi:leader peptidase (prepilin peptidase) / N-methyltransferase
MPGRRHVYAHGMLTVRAVSRRIVADRAGLVLAAVLVAAAIAFLGPRPLTIGLVWLALVTPTLIATDIAEHRLPDVLVLPGYPIALAAAAADTVLHGSSLRVAVTSGAVYGVVLLILHLFGGLGLGDVKLAPVLGVLAGCAGPAAALLGPLVAFLVGGVLAAVALVRFGPKAHIPFGPPMLLGAWIAVLAID